MARAGKARRQLLRLYRHHRGLCAYCNRKTTLPGKELNLELEGTGLKATRDHIKPLGHGGRDRMDNLVLSCARCNHRKADSYIPTSDVASGFIVDLTKDPNYPKGLRP